MSQGRTPEEQMAYRKKKGLHLCERHHYALISENDVPAYEAACVTKPAIKWVMDAAKLIGDGTAQVGGTYGVNIPVWNNTEHDLVSRVEDTFGITILPSPDWAWPLTGRARDGGRTKGWSDLRVCKPGCWCHSAVAACSDAPSPLPVPEKIAGTQLPEIYVVGSTIPGVFKIGSTANPKNRLATLQTGSPVPLRTLWHQEHPDARGMEHRLHAFFAERRMHGEHFCFDDTDPVAAVAAAVVKLMVDDLKSTI